MGVGLQDAVCAFVREILEARTGETIAVTDRPERVNRSDPVVEELWASESHRYAVEHTLLESYGGQLANEAKLRQLILPVREFLVGRLLGSHVLAVRVSETAVARMKYAEAHKEIIELTLAAAATLKDEQTVVLPSTKLPFAVQLHRRHGNGSHVAIHCLIEGEGEDLRLHRMRRALKDKCPKLVAWARDGRTSVLALEANDIQLSNVFVAFAAFKQALAERDDIPMPHGHRCYTEGQVR
jgi:hypothetical protein